MRTSPTTSRLLPAAAVAGALLGAVFVAGPAAAADYRNTTAGGSLRPGVYGRIAIKEQAPPPPVIYPQPTVASDSLVAQRARPVYLYVPPGQVRKWKQHCAKWSACDEPVLFVRMEQNPGRWGQWRQLREQQVALQTRD
ncbi:MAG TPA: hypothetical protein VHL79_14975 [Ramlibacter sp.]|jgi:hypothetical protein|nr:hypothetical protein [Ramlibacter sp.]